LTPRRRTTFSGGRREEAVVIGTNGRLAQLREMVAEVLEIDPDELDETSDFVEEYEADSLRAIEILSRIERMYKVEIPQSELATMRSLKGVNEVVVRYVGP
jgi:acyl carrier protein